MRVVFWTSDKNREHATADAVRAAVEAAGDTFVERCTAVYERPDHEADVACAIGVKGKTQRIMLDCGRIGQRFIMFDKAHLYPRDARRNWETWRVSMDGMFPNDYLMECADLPERFSQLGWTVQPTASWADPDKAIAFVGSSDKHLAWHGIEDAREYAEKICKLLRKRYGREVIYRPKPSWVNGQPGPIETQHIGSTTFSAPDEPFAEVLARCCLVVVAGSNASVEALVSGVAVACTTDNIATPILGLPDLAALHRVRVPPREVLMPWLNAVAWQQFAPDEMPLMWGMMRERALRPLRERPAEIKRQGIDRLSPPRDRTDKPGTRNRR